MGGAAGAGRALRTTSGCVVDAKDSGELEPSKVFFFFTSETLQGTEQKDGKSKEGGKSAVRRATAAHLVQQLALHSQLPRGHLLRLLALRLAGRVRVGDVDPELSLLLSHRVEGRERTWRVPFGLRRNQLSGTL